MVRILVMEPAMSAASKCNAMMMRPITVPMNSGSPKTQSASHGLDVNVDVANARMLIDQPVRTHNAGVASEKPWEIERLAC